MLSPIELNFKVNKDGKSAFRTEKIIKSHDINSVEFHISFDGLELTDEHTVKVLSIFHDSQSQTNVNCEIEDGKAIYRPDTSIISQNEHVQNYVYVYHGDQSLDVREFLYSVSLSKIDETALKVKEVYDQSYANLLADFEQALENYKDSLPQASDLRSEVDVILNKFKVDSQNAIGYLGEVSTTAENAEASRVQAESERVQAETERKEAETLREESYEQLIDTAIIEADVVEKVDNKVTELTPQISNLTAQLAHTDDALNKRVDNLVIPISPENVNVEVTDAHVSTVKNRLFTSLKNRFEDVEMGINHLVDQTHLTNEIINGNFVDTSIWVKHANSTFTVANNTATLIPAFSTDGLGQGSVISGHKYYYKADIKTTSDSARISFPGIGITAIGDNTFHKTVAYGTASQTDTGKAFKITDSTVSNHVPIYIKNVIAVDLTTVFGVGKEPTLAEFELLLSNFTDSWFDGSADLFDTDKMFTTINAKIDNQDEVIDAKIDEQNINVVQVLDGGDFNSPDVFGGTATKFRGVSISDPTFLDSTISFSATAANGKLVTPNVPVETGHYHYVFARVKSKSSEVGLATGYMGSYANIKGSGHSGSDGYELLSGLYYSNKTIDMVFGIIDKRTSNWDEIKVDYMGVIDVTNYIDNDELMTKVYLDEIVRKEGFNTVYNITKSKHLFDAIRRNDTNFYRPTNISGYDGNTETNAETITVAVLYKLWDALIAEYPKELTKSVLGVDASGTYNISRVVFKPIGAKTKILITANMHGNGTNGDPKDSSLAVYEFIKDILDNHKSSKALEFLRYNVELDIIPCANPWGYNNDTRENSNGVDLNRNANSITPQAETVIMKNWLSVNKDARLYLDVHAFGITVTSYNLTAFAGTDIDSFEKKVINEVGDYLSSVHRTSYVLGPEPDGAVSKYAKSTLNIPSLLTEFSVYADGMPTHSAEMMTKYVEWIGNVIYKSARQSPYVHDDMILRTPDGMNKYKISIDNNGVLTTTLVS